MSETGKDAFQRRSANLDYFRRLITDYVHRKLDLDVHLLTEDNASGKCFFPIHLWTFRNNIRLLHGKACKVGSHHVRTQYTSEKSSSAVRISDSCFDASSTVRQ